MKNKHILIYRKQKNIEIILDYLDIPFAWRNFDFLSTNGWMVLTTWFFVWFRVIWNYWNQQQGFESFNFLKIHFRYFNTRDQFRMKTNGIFDTEMTPIPQFDLIMTPY